MFPSVQPFLKKKLVLQDYIKKTFLIKRVLKNEKTAKFVR